MPVSGRFRIVRDHQDGLVQARVEIAQKAEHRSGVFGIEISRGLVGQKQRGLIDQRARDGHALLFASGKSARLVVQAFLDTEQRRISLEVRIHRRSTMARDIARDLDVIGRAERRQQIIFLKHEADFCFTQLCALGVGHRSKIPPIDLDDA